MKVAPIHSVKLTAPKVYHDNDRCTERNNIEKENVRQGTDGRPLCENCQSLNQKGQ